MSWFEAAAFARWCGKRLPTEAEWTKAAAWPVESSPHQIIQRRYPWGDEFDAKRANIWGSGPNRAVSVYGFSTGASVGGAHQLIGNVWEWTASNYGSPGDVTLRLPTAMKTLRGGSFDTYFAVQATCHFQSGDSPLARRHNVGFRLAIGACDVAADLGPGVRFVGNSFGTPRGSHMSPSVEIPLDTYRLMEIAQPIPCYLCGGDNAQNTEHCRHCRAPMALAHQAKANRVQPRMVAVLGASAAGKTVYLGMMMDMLSRRNHRLQVLARGAFSITLQQTTATALAQCRFPDKTPCEPDHWNWVHCQVFEQKRKQPLELVFPDMAGEAIEEEIDHPNSYPVVRSLLGKCQGVIILVDAIRLHAGDPALDFSTMKLLSLLGEIDEKRKKEKRAWKRAKTPVAVVFTKSDQCDQVFDDPVGFADRHASGIVRVLDERFPHHRYYATGVAGACAFRESVTEGRRRVPLRIEPRGIVEPVEWMISQIAALKN